MNLISEFSFGVTTSLIGSFIFILILPYIKKFGIYLVSLFVKINKHYSDNIYKNLHKTDSNQISSFTYVISFITTCISFLILFSINDIKDKVNQFEVQYQKNYYKDKQVNYYKLLTSISPEISKGIDSVINKSPEAFYDRMKDNLQKANVLMDSVQLDLDKIRDIKYSTGMESQISIILFILILFSFIIHSQYQYKLSKIKLFQNKLIAIRPNLSSNDYIKMQQKWILIRNADDYNKLNSFLDEQIKNHNINF